MSRKPSLRRSPRAFRAWGLFFFSPALVILALSGPTVSAEGKYFQVKMLSPQYFRIKPQVQGPVASFLKGGKDSRQLINRQEDGQTVIYARVPPGATLTIQVQDCYLKLWMKNSTSFQIQEECKSRSLKTGSEEKKEEEPVKTNLK